MKNFLFSLLILLAALALQFLAASFGYSFDFVLAALVVFAFMLDWREFLPLTLFAALVLNWQPTVSPAILVYLFLPFVAFATGKFLSWEPWAVIIFMVAIGAIALGLVAGIGIDGRLALGIFEDAIVMIASGLLMWGAERKVL